MLNFNIIQRALVVLGCAVIVYLVFFNPPKLIHGVNGVIVNANEYCKDPRNKMDCDIAIVNTGLLSLYLLVISLVTALLVFVSANKKGNL